VWQPYEWAKWEAASRQRSQHHLGLCDERSRNFCQIERTCLRTMAGGPVLLRNADNRSTVRTEATRILSPLQCRVDRWAFENPK